MARAQAGANNRAARLVKTGSALHRHRMKKPPAEACRVTIAGERAEASPTPIAPNERQYPMRMNILALLLVPAGLTLGCGATPDSSPQLAEVSSPITVDVVYRG